MYNVYQFLNKKQQNEQEAKKEKEHNQFIAKHEEYKKYAHGNLIKKSNSFIESQMNSKTPFVFEDDHYQRWRNHRIYRDIENQNKFMGDKVFKHRPNQDMDKYYDERERKQKEYLASKKQDLVKNGIIPSEHISRSITSQGPYNPKVEFRQIRKDEQYLQPRLRFSNVTDKQRLSESQMQFDQRLSSIYEKFQKRKLRVGKSTKSNFAQLPDDNTSGMSSSEMKTTQSLSMRKSSLRGIEQPEEMSGYNSTQMFGDSKRKSKTYFKLAKMMEMFHPQIQKRQQVGELLKKSQFQRKKDLTNIRSNSFNENYSKHPIL